MFTFFALFFFSFLRTLLSVSNALLSRVLLTPECTCTTSWCAYIRNFLPYSYKKGFTIVVTAKNYNYINAYCKRPALDKSHPLQFTLKLTRSNSLYTFKGINRPFFLQSLSILLHVHCHISLFQDYLAVGFQQTPSQCSL